MTLFRVIDDQETGLRTEIPQIAIRNEAGDQCAIDVGEAIPDGWFEFNPITEPVPVPVVVPAMIKRRQGRLALVEAGLLLSVEAAIAGIEDPTQSLTARVEYEADTWERSNPWIDQLGTSLGLSSEQIDALFIAASNR